MRLHFAAIALAAGIGATPVAAAPSPEFYSFSAVQAFMGKYRCCAT